MTDETTPTAPTAHERLNKKRVGATWQQYFAEKKDGDVWVQNLTDMQISLDIEIGPGVTQGRLIPPTPHPLCLTEEYSFETLKRSGNFRKTINKRRDGRPNLILLGEEQVEAYYRAMAEGMNARDPDGEPNTQAAMDAAEKQRVQMTTRQQEDDEVNASNLHGFKPPKSAQELIAMDLSNRGVQPGEQGFSMGRDQAGMPANMMHSGAIQMEEVVNPKVIHLCQQVSPQIPQSMRMTAESFFTALQALQNSMTVDDYQHVEAHGTYRTVKAWARQRLSKLVQGDEGLPDDLTLPGQQQVGQADRQGALNVIPGGPPTASLAQQNMQYEGPSGFANAPLAELGGAAEPAGGFVVGPDGQPL